MSRPDDKSTTDKRALLTELLQKRAREDVVRHPLSHGQQALLYLYKRDPQSAAYNTAFTVRVRSPIDIAALQRAVSRILNRHSALRATFAFEDDVPVQIVRGYETLSFEVEDVSGASDQELMRRAEAVYRRPFDLVAGPLLRVHLLRAAVDNAVLILGIHHIVRDAWSMNVLLGEFRQFYEAEVTGVSVRVATPPATYADYVRERAELLAGPEGDEMLSYWKRELAGDLPTLNLPLDHPRGPVLSSRGGSMEVSLDVDIGKRIRAIAQESKVTSFTLLLAAYQLLLCHYTGEPEVIVGTPTLGRGRRGRFDEVVGYFSNVVPIRADTATVRTFREFMARQHERVLGALANEDYPFSLLVRKLNVARDASRSPLFQAMFVFVRVPKSSAPMGLALPGADGSSVDFGGLKLEPFGVPQEEGQFDCGLNVVERDSGFHMTWKFSTDLFERETIERMAAGFNCLLEQVLADPERDLAATSPVTRSEAVRLLQDYNRTEKDLPEDLAVHRLVEEQVLRSPNAIATVDCAGEVSYGELDRRANRLARRLQSKAGSRPLVAIHMEPSVSMLVATLAVLKAGGVYIPLDPSYPINRREYILSDSGATVMLVDDNVPSELQAHAAFVIDVRSLATDGLCDAKLGLSTDGDDPAYIIYTSGTTGRPKGVLVRHASLTNLLRSLRSQPGMAREDVLLSITSLSFDIAFVELFLPLTVGGRLEIGGRRLATDPKLLRERLERGDITLMQATSTSWKMLIDAGWDGSSLLKVICTGEALPRSLADELLPRAESVWNLYGPTETTVYSILDRVRPDDRTVPIGLPIANTSVYVLNAAMQPVPVGVAGELYIGGIGVALGYHKRPELTAQRFLTNPFGSGRLYRTGDRVRRRPDGRIEFLERMDDQVKLHGHRIELSEVEAVLLEHPSILEAAVVKRDRGDGQPALVSFVVCESAFESSNIRQFLKTKLPEPMVPSVFVRLESLPRTPSGKTNRNELISLDLADAEPVREIEPARDELEEKLVALWKKVLHLNQVGINDNFFALGGASVQSIHMATVARQTGIPISPEHIFRYQTIAELADAIRATPTSVPNPFQAYHEVQVPEDLLAEHERLVATVENEAGVEPIEPAAIRIESLGTYLPDQIVTTEEVLRGCRNEVTLDLQKLTGIKARCRAGSDEYSIDLAVKAVEDCLSRSRYRPEEIDLLICCNISRYDGSNRVVFEPSTAVRLQAHFGFTRARVFDLSNACAGMFTAIKVVDAFARNGTVERALVVSGEYITHLQDTAQLEIEDFLDPRMACLTVGDAGAAMILERSPDGRSGFHDVQLFTLGNYSRMCIAKPTDRPHGGAIMLTDSIGLTDVAIRKGVVHAMNVLVRSKLPASCFQHFIMHQASRMTINNAVQEINRLFDRRVCHAGNTIDNVAERGNTSTTTHSVALMDHIRNGRIRTGDRIFFSISGSGITLGTAVYTLDDLPDRIRSEKKQLREPLASPTPTRPDRPRVRIKAVGTVPRTEPSRLDTLAALNQAASLCVGRDPESLRQVDLLLYSGVYRTDYISEPAIAAMLAGDLGLNTTFAGFPGESRTLAFDVFNGGIGFLDACNIAVQFLQTRASRRALVTTAEVENNAGGPGRDLLGLEEGAGAILLEPSERCGFGSFLFGQFTEHMSAFQSYCSWSEGDVFMRFEQCSDLEERYLSAIAQTVAQILSKEAIRTEDIALVLPPQRCSSFVERLSARLDLGRARYVKVATDRDLFTTSFPYTMEVVRERGLAKEGDLALIIDVGSGIQVGCALYYF